MTSARSRATTPWLRMAMRALLALVLVGIALTGSAGSASAASYVPISGAGSTWSQNALDQWIRNVNQYGIKVNYAGTGSSDGRRQFANGTVDFGVSEIPYGIKDGTSVDAPPRRGFTYMPIVAGGTAFMYNLQVGNRRVTNLRLSGETITKIFTGVITNWSDPQIKADNPGLALPARKIVPVVRSDGSGTTAQFTTFMSHQYGGMWDAYCRKVGRFASPCGVTSNFPTSSGFVAQSGSLGVAGYTAQAQSVGAITYVEYSYALNSGFPIAKVLNKAGYYVEPTAPSVAVGLLGARINPDLTQNLDGVYNNADRRTYPLSSYSYMIVPTKAEGTFSTAKGATLAAFANYFLCEGQQKAPVLGYSPLPINLVQAAFTQVRRIPGAVVSNVDIRKCNNPTFSPDGSNLLAKTAPFPSECDKLGASQCSTGTGGARQATPTLNSGGAASAGGSGAGTPGGGTGAAGTSAGAGGGGSGGSGGGAATGAGPAGAAGSAGGAGGAIDPETGLPVDGSASSGTLDAASVPVSTAASLGGGTQTSLMVLAALLLLGIVVGPPLIARRLPFVRPTGATPPAGGSAARGTGR